jgi:hypothetical protein
MIVSNRPWISIRTDLQYSFVVVVNVANGNHGCVIDLTIYISIFLHNVTWETEYSVAVFKCVILDNSTVSISYAGLMTINDGSTLFTPEIAVSVIVVATKVFPLDGQCPLV